MHVTQGISVHMSPRMVLQHHDAVESRSACDLLLPSVVFLNHLLTHCVFLWLIGPT